MNQDAQQKIIKLLDAASAQATQLEDKHGGLELFTGSIQAVAAHIKGTLFNGHALVNDQVQMLEMLDRQLCLLMQEVDNVRDALVGGKINVQPVEMVTLVFTMTAAIRSLILLGD